MDKVKLLDCTLRDGGYINDWQFGHNTILDITKSMTESYTADIFEIGFLKNEPYQPDRTVFNDVDQIIPIIGKKNPNIRYAAMIEVVNPLPIEQLKPCDGKSVDIIRVIVWKRLLQEGYEYCREIVKKGYQLCVQPARVDQYSDEEFMQMCRLFSGIHPLAVYVVDSWGTQHTENIMHYARLADRTLSPDVAIGYHGHNNLMQAYGTAQEFIKLDTDRTRIVDASIYGIGRGAGNLNLELIAKYLNDTSDKQYQTKPLYQIYDNYLEDIYREHPWGYSLAFYLTAQYGCNPNYANYYGSVLHLSSNEINEILQTISAEDKIIFRQENADKYLENYRNECKQ